MWRQQNARLVHAISRDKNMLTTLLCVVQFFPAALFPLCVSYRFAIYDLYILLQVLCIGERLTGSRVALYSKRVLVVVVIGAVK